MGATDLSARLDALGFPTYDDVIRTLVPAEVDERRRLAPLRAPHTARGEMLHEVVSAIKVLDRELAAQRARYEDATAVAATLDTAQAEFTVTLAGLEAAAAAAADAAATVATEAPAAAKTAQAALSLAEAARSDLSPLSRLLADVRASVLDLRANLALSVLHNDMAMVFAAEVGAGESIGEPDATVWLLGTAVSNSVREGEQQSQHVREELGQVVCCDWRGPTEVAGVPADADQLAARGGAIRGLSPTRVTRRSDRQRLSAGLREIDDLDDLAKRCAALGQTLDSRCAARSRRGSRGGGAKAVAKRQVARRFRMQPGEDESLYPWPLSFS